MFDGVSAWRNYFIANEWLKLTTKRKCCMFYQILMVAAIMLVFFLHFLIEWKRTYRIYFIFLSVIWF